MTIELPLLGSGRSDDASPGGPPGWGRRMETQGERAALRGRDDAGLKVCLVALPNIVANRKRRYHQVPPMGVAYLAAFARESARQKTA